MFETPLERLKIHAEYAQLDNDCCIVNREDLQYLIREYEEITKKLQKRKKFVKFSTKNEKTSQKLILFVSFLENFIYLGGDFLKKERKNIQDLEKNK